MCNILLIRRGETVNTYGTIILGAFHSDIPRTKQSQEIVGGGIDDNGMVILVPFENRGGSMAGHVFVASHQIGRHDFLDEMIIQRETNAIGFDQVCFRNNSN